MLSCFFFSPQAFVFVCICSECPFPTPLSPGREAQRRGARAGTRDGCAYTHTLMYTEHDLEECSLKLFMAIPEEWGFRGDVKRVAFHDVLFTFL